MQPDDTLDARRRAIPKIARAKLIAAATAQYLHSMRHRMSSLSALLSILFDRRSIREDEEALALTRRITTEFEELLDLARSMTGWFRTPRDIDVRPLSVCIRRATEEYASNMHRRGINLEITFQNGCGDPLIPATILEQAMGAVLENCLDACESARGHGLVQITVAANGAEVTLSVEDNGPGIAPHVLPNIGQPFFTTRPDRHGLGLCIVQSMLQNVGGGVVVENLRPHGARALITLPLNWKEYVSEEDTMD